MSADVLTTIVAAARKSAEARARVIDRDTLERGISALPRGGAFRASIASPGIRVIAECKRRSPSRGILRERYDPAAIAKAYEQAGAAAISVLTEPSFFDGHLDHLSAVRCAVQTPTLRKDFNVVEYQVVEAAAKGADAVLLIVAALDDPALRRLGELSTMLGLAALVEVHDRDELQRALDAGADIIGVNCRNLRTLEVHPQVLDDLGVMIPRHIVAVAESGLKTAADLRRLKAARYDAFLIGERFMTDDDPGAGLAALIGGSSEVAR